METGSEILQHGILDMITGSGLVVQGVLYLLIILSLWSWTITIAKYLQLRKAKSESEEFASLFWEVRSLSRIDDSSERLQNSPLAQVFRAGYREFSHLLGGQRAANESNAFRFSNLETVQRALRRAEQNQSLRLERGVTYLATVASAAPFIGLFGTVWGIMNAFQSLGTAGSNTIQAVAPGISEALVATAIGLAAAIPAAVAYNYFAVAIRHARESMDKFSDEFLTLAKQQID